MIIDSGRLKEVDKRDDHAQKCTQCSYWMHKVKIYLRKVDRHMFQEKTASGVCTANFNSFEIISQPQNGMLGSFGPQLSQYNNKATIKSNNTARYNKKK